MKRIMIDIETLDIIETAVILSIGAVEFDVGGLGREFHCALHWSAQRNRTQSACVWEFWRDQNKEESSETFEGSTPLSYGLNMLAKWMERGTEVWANGVVFDIGILENAFRTEGVKVPWEYFRVQDFRTIRNRLGTREDHVGPIRRHHAISDAIGQAKTLLNINKRMGGVILENEDD